MKYLKSADPGNGGMNDADLGSDLISPDGNSSPGREESNSSPEDFANEIPNGNYSTLSNEYLLNKLFIV